MFSHVNMHALDVHCTMWQTIQQVQMPNSDFYQVSQVSEHLTKN